MFNKRNLRILVAVLLLVMCTGLLAFAETGHHDNLGKELPLWSCIPFVGMLLSIAIFPLVKPHWWEMNMLKVALFWSLLFLIPFGFAFGMGALSFQIAEIVFLDYLPFIVLLFGLFVAAGESSSRVPLRDPPRQISSCSSLERPLPVGWEPPVRRC